MSTMAVLILILSNGWDHETRVTPIYFQSMAACESAMPAIVEQARSATNETASAVCYEEAGSVQP